MVTSCRGYEKNWCQGFGGQISLFDEPSDGSLGINYTVSMVETWGGQNEICGHNCGTFPLPNLQLPIRYPCDGATRMSLKLRVGQPLLPGLATQKMALRLLLYDTSHCSYRCNEGRSVEQWYHAWTAEDTLAYNGTEWRELNISLAESVVGDNEDALFGNTFALPLWSGIGGNLKLDPGAVTNWVLQFSMDGQPPNEFNASGQIFVANLTCSGSPDFYNAMDQEESNLYAQPPLGLSGQLSGGSLPTDADAPGTLACDASAMPLEASASAARASTSQTRAVGISRELVPPTHFNLSGATELTAHFMVARPEADVDASLRLSLRYNGSSATFSKTVPLESSLANVTQTLAINPPAEVVEALSGVSIQLVGNWTTLAVNVRGPFVTSANGLPAPWTPTWHGCSSVPTCAVEIEAAFVSDLLRWSSEAATSAARCCEVCEQNQPQCTLSAFAYAKTKFSTDRRGEPQCLLWNTSAGGGPWGRNVNQAARVSDVIKLEAIFAQVAADGGLHFSQVTNRSQACGPGSACVCSASVIDCNDANLYTVPAIRSLTAVDLSLERNPLTVVTREMLSPSDLPKLQRLKFGGSSVTFISPKLLQSLQLQSLEVVEGTSGIGNLATSSVNDPGFGHVCCAKEPLLLKTTDGDDLFSCRLEGIGECSSCFIVKNLVRREKKMLVPPHLSLRVPSKQRCVHTAVRLTRRMRNRWHACREGWNRMEPRPRTPRRGGRHRASNNAVRCAQKRALAPTLHGMRGSSILNPFAIFFLVSAFSRTGRKLTCTVAFYPPRASHPLS